MSVRNLKWTPFLMLTKKEVLRFCRVLGQTLVVPLVNSSLYLLIFGVSLGRNIYVSSEFSYLAFLIPGLVMMGVLNNAFQNSSSSIATSKFHGDLEDLRKSPLTPMQILAAMSVGGLIRGILVGAVTFLVGEVFYLYSNHHLMAVAHPFILAFFLFLGVLVFAQLGIAIGFWAKSIDQLSSLGGFVLLPLMYLGGVFFSLNQLHPFWRTLSRFNPMLYFINGVRYGILGHSEIGWQFSALVALISLFIISTLALRTIRYGSYSRW